MGIRPELTSDVDSELPHRPHWRSVFSSVFKELLLWHVPRGSDATLRMRVTASGGEWQC